METEDGNPVSVPKVHFGYVDGISMTTIRGGPEHTSPITRNRASPGCSWLLSTKAENYFVPEPPELGRNGSSPCSK